MNVEVYIDEINEMLFAAYAHGGDSGGPYGSEHKWMEESVLHFLEVTGLKENYMYCNIDIKPYSKVPQIVKKELFDLF